MKMTITPAKLSGSITPPPSKSQGHRLLIAALLAGGRSGDVENLPRSQDMEATERCMAALLNAPDGRSGLSANPPRLDCGESGSTLRFLIPLALALRGGGVFTGRGRLMERPQTPYFDLFDRKGVFHELRDGVLTVRGTLTSGVYPLPGDVSSQFVTGLLYALPLLPGDSEIVLTTPLESRSYVDMTVDALARFGVTVTPTERGYAVPGGQACRPAPAAVEADWSQAGFWYAAAGLGNAVTVEGMNPRSLQGDRVAAELMTRLDGTGEETLDVSDCPDLVPPLAARAALRAGCVTHIVNAARLRIKESDRLSAVTGELRKLGVDVAEGADFLTIRGRESLRGGEVESRNDHRIAMMLAVAATRADGPVVIRGAEAVNKSYPRFWEDYQQLGGILQCVT